MASSRAKETKEERLARIAATIAEEEEGEEYSFSVPYSLLECCIVSGLSNNTKIEALNDLFSPYGDIVESEIINDRETGEPTGFGYVSLSNEKSMNDAVEGLNGHNLEGHTITVYVSRIRKYVENYGRRLSGSETKTKD